MEKELKKFEVLEKSYQNIKKVTGVEEVEEIVDKFIHKE